MLPFNYHSPVRMILVRNGEFCGSMVPSFVVIVNSGETWITKGRAIQTRTLVAVTFEALLSGKFPTDDALPRG